MLKVVVDYPTLDEEIRVVDLAAAVVAEEDLAADAEAAEDLAIAEVAVIHQSGSYESRKFAKKSN